MPVIISRAQAGLPPVPSSVGHRSLSSWAGIKVHHTGGRFSSWRAIYDWQVLNRPAGERLVYIGYSFGVAGGRVTELRGWDRAPAHDHQNSTLGVVLGGNYESALPPEEDLEALVWFCQEARRRTGRRLPITGHRDTWPREDYRWSTCPGDRLYAWLPTLRARADHEEDDMPLTNEDLAKIAARVWSERWGSPGQGIEDMSARDWVKPARSIPDVKAKVEALLAAVAGQDAVAAVRAAVREEFAALGPALAAQLDDVPAERVEAALRSVLGS